MSAGITLHEAEEKNNKPVGFFPKLFENICNDAGAQLVESLEAFKGDKAAMFEFTYNLKSFKKSLTIKEFYPEKNAHEYKVKKDYGNKAYGNGKDIDALYYYTQAVIAAPSNKTGQSKELAIALANRSAVLFSLKAYPLALDDILLALESGYPPELQYKLLERRAKIFMMYKQFSDARETYKATLKALDDSHLPKDKKYKLQKEIQQTLTVFEKSNHVKNDSTVIIHDRVKDSLPKLQDPNPNYPAMSSSISFRYEPQRGRYAVANREINIGEYICVEKPIVTHMLPDYMGSNCTNCFKVMKNPMPCPTCTKVMFCSYQCRKQALETYHPYECKMVDFLIASGMSVICFMAYRTITQKSLRFFKKNKELFKLHDEKNGSYGTKGLYRSNDYRNLFNLVTHGSERKVGDVFHRMMLAVMLLKCLTLQGYFENKGILKTNEENDDKECIDDILSEDQKFIGLLLVHFLEVYQFNAHEVAQFEMLMKDREEGSKSVFIGAGVYPTLALFNHSCDPSIVRYYVEDVVCVQAIKRIRKGEEVNENYGPIFFHSPKTDRQSRLKSQYWFDCQCIPCLDNWPLMHDMTNDTLTFRCEICGDGVPFLVSSSSPLLKCGCGTSVPILKFLKVIADAEPLNEEAQKKLKIGELAEAQRLYSEYLTILDDVIVPPYQDYYKIQQSIWKCIWMRFGNRMIRGKNRKPPVVPTDDDYDTVD